MSHWHFQTRQFLLAKSGHELSECEDAIGINESTRAFAIADGATEAFAAQSWALKLAHQWVLKNPAPLSVDKFRSWAAAQGEALHDSWDNLQFSWYAEEKSRTGSFAAFIGLQLELDADQPRWQAIALGDACLIHSRKHAIVTALPLTNHQSFNATPLLLPSRSSLQEFALSNLVVRAGTIESGDVLLLFSDAAAAWYLRLNDESDQTSVAFEELIRAG